VLAGDTDPTVATLPPPTTTAAQVTDITGGPECATGDLDFVDEGVIATMGTGSADAAAVNELRWDTELGCDRFVVGFATAGGSPASSLGQTTVELLPGRGILRVRLPPAVVATSLAEATVDGTVVTRAVVVGLIEGSLAIDLHLDSTRGVRARSFFARAPARLVVDVRAAGDRPLVSPPAGTFDTVVLTPRGGVATYPLLVNGYTTAASVTVGISEGSIPVPIEAKLAGNGTPWAEFEATVASGPIGTVELVVESAMPDAEPRRIRILLDLQ